MQRTIGLVHVRGSDYVSYVSLSNLGKSFRQVSGKLSNEEIGKRGWIPSAERLTCLPELFKTGVAQHKAFRLFAVVQLSALLRAAEGRK